MRFHEDIRRLLYVGAFLSPFILIGWLVFG